MSIESSDSIIYPRAKVLCDQGQWKLVEGPDVFKDKWESISIELDSLKERVKDNAPSSVPCAGRWEGMRRPFYHYRALSPTSAWLMVLDRGQEEEYRKGLQKLMELPAENKPAPIEKETPMTSNESFCSSDELRSTLERAVKQERFQHAALELVNGLRTAFSCWRVSLHWDEEVKAISLSEEFEKKTDHLQDLNRIHLESEYPLSYPAENAPALLERYSQAHQLSWLEVLPLKFDDEKVGSLCFEGAEGKAPIDIDRVPSLVTPVLVLRHKEDRPLSKKGLDALLAFLGKLVGPEHAGKKVLSLILVGILIFMIFAKLDHRVQIGVQVETHQRSYVSAPFDGFVHDVLAHPGDVVTAGNVLLELDTRELLMKESESLAEISRYDAEIEKSRAKKSFADMKIAEARKKQSEARLKQVHHYLEQSKVRSPIEGIVVEGERQELLGAPVSKGDMIFQVVQTDGYFLKMEVPEKDIIYIKAGQKGEVSLLSRPDLNFDLEVLEIIPVGQTKSDQGNHFVVQGRFDAGPADWMRPGMSGLAKVKVGERSPLWLLTHDVIDRLRMILWW